MNLKHKALGLVAALGLAASVASPALAETDTATANVTLNEVGEFTVVINSDLSFGSYNQSARSDKRELQGDITIKYIDTLSWRDLSFYSKLRADDFAKANSPHIIPANNLVILENHNPVQGRWSGQKDSNGNPMWDYPIGDIGATNDGAYASAGCQAGTGPGSGTSTQAELDAGRVRGGGDAAYWDWTKSATSGNSLDQQRTVACGFAGAGTAGSFVSFGTTQRIHVKLTVPAGQPAGAYSSTLHLDVVDNSL
jgi:hypothetical protein